MLNVLLLKRLVPVLLPNPGVLVLAPKGNDVEVCGLVKRLFPVFCPNVKEFVLGVLKFIDLFPNNPGVVELVPKPVALAPNVAVFVVPNKFDCDVVFPNNPLFCC